MSLNRGERIVQAEQLEKFWDTHEPEEFEGWQEGNLKFKRPPKKLIQLRLDPSDVRYIDRESKVKKKRVAH